VNKRRRLPHVALLVLAALLAGVVCYLTWPSRAAVLCEQLPQLTVLAICAASLFVFSIRARSGARDAGESWQLSAGSAILAALAFFLSAHFIAQYRKPCVAVQQQLRQPAKHP
jgi:hypothetical protein